MSGRTNTPATHRTTRRAAARPAAAWLALALLSATGCASRGVHPVRIAEPDAPSATLRNTKADGVETYLVSVDGRPVPYKKIVVSADLSVPVILPAGVRHLEVTIAEANALWGQMFDYSFVAGHAYELTSTRRGENRLVVVVDQTTGTRLVIEKPKRPPDR